MCAAQLVCWLHGRVVVELLSCERSSGNPQRHSQISRRGARERTLLGRPHTPQLRHSTHTSHPILSVLTRALTGMLQRREPHHVSRR